MRMKYYKTSKLLNNPTVPKFVTKKWIKTNDLSQNFNFKIILM